MVDDSHGHGPVPFVSDLSNPACPLTYLWQTHTWAKQMVTLDGSVFMRVESKAIYARKVGHHYTYRNVPRICSV